VNTLEKQPEELRASRGLSPETVAEIEALAAICNAAEGLDLKLNWELMRQRPDGQTNDFLFYRAGALVGFAGVYDLGKLETCGMVHPSHRRQGIGLQLLTAVLDEGRRRGVADLLLVCERRSASGQAFVATTAARYHHSEYRMARSGDAPPPPHGDDLALRVATAADLPVLIPMLSIGFDVAEETTREMIAPQLGAPGSRTYVASLGDTPVGTIGLGLGERSAFLAGLVVLPEFRGRGYGRQIFSRAIVQMLAEGRTEMGLEVMADNPQTLRLYRSCGFRETETYDYFTLEVSGGASG
jgi:ribosomal protein S18 acetylase RimI-like enzyme